MSTFVRSSYFMSNYIHTPAHAHRSVRVCVCVGCDTCICMFIKSRFEGGAVSSTNRELVNKAHPGNPEDPPESNFLETARISNGRAVLLSLR